MLLLLTFILLKMSKFGERIHNENKQTLKMGEKLWYVFPGAIDEEEEGRWWEVVELVPVIRINYVEIYGEEADYPPYYLDDDWKPGLSAFFRPEKGFEYTAI